MIVKNEAEVIRRCLDSVRPIIDHWIIVDTGSTDGTQDIIREHLADLPGHLHERPWRDFAYNRSEALELARGKADYTFIIDADDALELTDGSLPALSADSYMVTINDTSLVYQRPQLVRNAMPWRYEGVLHEYLTCEGAAPPAHLSGIRMRRNHDGARRKDPQTYLRDAAVLEKALETETNPFLMARYRFYLAQSHRDSRDRQKALTNYLLRADMGYWQEEVFISLYYAAQIQEDLGFPDQDVLDAYLKAADALPTRAEALHKASRFCRQKLRYEEGYQYARRGLAIQLRPDALFVEPGVYETGLLDELSIHAFWTGRNRECLDAALQAIATGKLSPADTQRVAKNAQYAMNRLPSQARPDARGEEFAARHCLQPARALHSGSAATARVLISIADVRHQEMFLPLYLKCIEALDYPKSAIVLSIEPQHGMPQSQVLLQEWLTRVAPGYAALNDRSKDEDSAEENLALSDAAQRYDCDFCLLSKASTFLSPCSLRELVSAGLPVVAPFLRSIEPTDPLSNFHADTDDRGYYKDSDLYDLVLHRRLQGLLEMPVVNHTYLVKTALLPQLPCRDGSGRHDYVVFSETARRHGIPQYLDNRQLYGYMARDASLSADVLDAIEERFSALAGAAGLPVT